MRTELPILINLKSRRTFGERKGIDIGSKVYPTRTQQFQRYLYIGSDCPPREDNQTMVGADRASLGPMSVSWIALTIAALHAIWGFYQ